MKRRWVIGSFFWLSLFLFSLSVHAQNAGDGYGPGYGGDPIQDPGTTLNNGPTPIGGFTKFSAYCSGSGFAQQLVVCANGPCTPDSSTLLCRTSIAFGRKPACVAPAPLANWGVSNPTSACCRVDGSCDALVTSPRYVGVSYSSNVSVSSIPLSPDWRPFKIARRSLSQYWVAIETSSGAQLIATMDAGKSWSAPLSLKSLVSASALPPGESWSGVSALNPVLGVDASGVVHAAFGLVDATTGKGAVYYSNCPTLPCSLVGNWGSAAPVLDSAFTVDEASGQWNRRFLVSHLNVRGGFVHLLFDDAEFNPSVRINGIFHKFCGYLPSSGSDCLASSDWLSPGAGPDITGGVSSGYAHAPALGVDMDGVIHAAWLDSAAPGDLARGIQHASFDPSGAPPSWSLPQSVSALGDFESPFITALDSRVMILARNATDGFHAWTCADSACIAPVVSWTNADTFVSNLNYLSDIQSYALLTSPSSPNRHVLLATALSQGVNQVFGLYENGSTLAGPFALTRGLAPSGTRLMGVGDPVPLVQSDSLDWVDFVGARSSGLNVFSSNVLDFSNALPVLSAFTAPNFPTWRNPALSDVSTTSYAEPIQFLVSDSNPEDVLYATLYAGASPGGSDYTLLDHIPLNSLQGMSSGSTCEGADFLSPRACTVYAPLFIPSPGLLIPDGEYYLTLLIQDSAYGQVSSALSGPLTIDASPSQFTLENPVGGEAVNPSQSTAAFFRFLVENPAFVHDLSVAVSLRNAGGVVYPYGSLSLATRASVSPSCTVSGPAGAPSYQCAFDFVPPASLPEGTYDFSFDLFEDMISNATAAAPGIAVDFAGPRLVDSFPSGTLSEPPAELSFTLSDSAGISGMPLITVNGQPRSINCTTPSPGTLSCSRSFPSSISSGGVTVGITSTDALTNTSVNTYSFDLASPSCPPGQTCTGPGTNSGDGGTNASGDAGGGGGGGGGSGSSDCRGPWCGLIGVDEEGNSILPGLPFISNTVVDTVVHGVETTLTVANDLVEVTGPSASAIFLGLCTLAGLASDAVFRRIFSGIHSDREQQRQRVLRAVLAGIFFAIPFLVNLQFSLAVGFVFAVMEIVGFLGASYVYKVLQYYETFGFKPVEGAH